MMDNGFSVRRSPRLAERSRTPSPDSRGRHLLSETNGQPRSRSATPNKRKIKDELSLIFVDLKENKNRKEHWTNEYDYEGLIVRRGHPFQFVIQFSHEIQLGKDNVWVVFEIGKKPLEAKRSLIRLKVLTENERFGWKSTVKDISANKWLFTVIPASDAIIGEYFLFIEFSNQDQPKPKVTRIETTNSFILLFNPWCKDDQVFMKSAKERDEYVLNESGNIFVGSVNSIQSLPWNFGQFEKVSLDVALYILRTCYLGDIAKGNPVKVARALAAMTNYNDKDGGIIVGRWSKNNYPKNSIRPTAWIGSVEILQRFFSKKFMVKYGQCWVFAGVLCTLMRTLGIPCRVVSNFESAHDTDSSHTIDYHFDVDGNPLHEINDSIWNFHVWNEVWMKRSDLPGEDYNGWQVVDATPQEPSEGIFQCGPASLLAVKNADVILPYDTGFVYSEVNGPIMHWTIDEENNQTLDFVNHDSVGRQISTKAIGSAERENITPFYKYNEGSKLEREATHRAIRFGTRKSYESLGKKQIGDFTLELKMPDQATIGEPITVTVSLKNNGQKSQIVKLTVHSVVTFYTGLSAQKLQDWALEVKVEAEASDTVSLLIPSAKYLPKMQESGCDAALKFFARAKVVDQIYFNQLSFSFCKPKIDIQIMSLRREVNKPLKVVLKFKNPLSIALTNGAFHIEGIGSTENDTIWPLGDGVKAKSNFKFEIFLTPKKVGKRTIIAGFDSDQLTGLTGTIDIKIEKIF